MTPTQAAVPQPPIQPTPPPLPATFDTSTVTPPQITWFDGATGELTGTYPQSLDARATRAAWQAAYDGVLAPWRAAWDVQVTNWQAACAALSAKNAAATPPIATLATDYPAAPVPIAPPALPAWTAGAVWVFDPAHMTAIAPPAVQAGFRPVFANGAWTQVEDHRNLPLYDATGASLPHMTTLGPLPAGALLVQPPPTAAQIAATLANARAAALAGVIAYADALAAKVTAQYPKAEQATWAEQLFEAKGYVAANATPTPLIDTIIAAAAAGGMPTAAQVAAVTGAQRQAMANGVIAKAAALNAIAVAIITLRSIAQAAIAAAPDLATLATTVTAIEAQAASAQAALGL